MTLTNNQWETILADFRILSNKPRRNAKIRRPIRSRHGRKSGGIWKKSLQKNLVAYIPKENLLIL